MQQLDSFDPSVTTPDNFIINLQQGGWLVLYNESPIGIVVTFGDATNAKVPPNFMRAIPVRTADRTVHWKQDPFYQLPVGQAPISRIFGETYESREWDQGAIMVPLPRQINIGNAQGAAVSNTIVNDGNAANTVVIETTETGSTGSNFKVDNAGNVLAAEFVATVYNKLLQIVAGAASGSDSVILGKSGSFYTHCLGLFKVDGQSTFVSQINAPGAAPNSNTFVDGIDFGNGSKVGTFGTPSVDLQVLSSGVVLVNGGAKVVLKGSASGTEFQDGGGNVKASIDQNGLVTLTNNLNQAANTRINLGGKTGLVTAAAFIGEGNLFGTENEMTIHSNGQNLSVMGDTTLYLKIDNYFDGVNDRVTTANAQPIQVRLDHLGLAIRFATNSGPTGTIITWGGFNYFPRTNFFNGSGAGTFSHGLATAPNWVGITENVLNSTETVGVDTIGATTVHVNVGVGGTAWLGNAQGF